MAICARQHAEALEQALENGEPEPPAQHVDDDFVGLVFHRLSELPSIRIGLLAALDPDDEPDGIDEDDEDEKPRKGQGSKSTRAKKKREKSKSGTRFEFEELDEAEIARPLAELLAEHGDDLRVAGDEETAWIAITGASKAARPGKFTDLVFDVAQRVWP